MTTDCQDISPPYQRTILIPKGRFRLGVPASLHGGAADLSFQCQVRLAFAAATRTARRELAPSGIWRWRVSLHFVQVTIFPVVGNREAEPTEELLALRPFAFELNWNPRS